MLVIKTLKKNTLTTPFWYQRVNLCVVASHLCAVAKDPGAPCDHAAGARYDFCIEEWYHYNTGWRISIIEN